MGTSLVTARPTTSLRPSWRSIDCSPEVLSSLNTGPKLIARFGERERPQHGERLGFGLREFARRVGVGDDARTGLYHDLVLQHEGGANRDAGVQRGRSPSHVPDRPRIRAAAFRFQ